MRVHRQHWQLCFSLLWFGVRRISQNQGALLLLLGSSEKGLQFQNACQKRRKQEIWVRMLPVCHFISPCPRCTQQGYQVEFISWQIEEMNSKFKLWGLPTSMQLLSCSCSFLRFLYWLFQLSDCGFMWWMCHIWSWIFPHVLGTAVGTSSNHQITGFSFTWHMRSMSILSSRQGREHFSHCTQPGHSSLPCSGQPRQREAISKWVSIGSGFCCSLYTATATSCEGR